MAKVLQQVDKYVGTKEFEKAISLLTNYELESVLTNDKSEPYYKLLMILYLTVDDLPNAKFLWKRSPKASKDDEYKAVWEIGKALWKRDYPAIYKALDAFKWSSKSAKYVDALKVAFRARTWKLVSVAYSKIKIDKAIELLGDKKEELVKQAKEFGWTVDGDYLATKPIIAKKEQDVGINQLNQLTEYVVCSNNMVQSNIQKIH